MDRKTRLALIFTLALVIAFAALTVQPVLAQYKGEPVWTWPFEKVQGVVNKVRAGKDMTPKSWPGGARVAVGLSFDVDTEPVWMGAMGQMSPGVLSRGEYGARVSVPRILALLDKYEISASFFTPAVTALLHPDAIGKILNKGRHEIGFHSWVHENVSGLTEEQERETYRKGMQAWKQFMGKTPVGVRTASWDFTDNTPKILKEFGLIYDTSLMADDRPYMILAEGKDTGIIELPVEWINDDWPLFQINWGASHVACRNADDVFKIWSGQFDKAYEEGTMFILTMHPQVIGHGYRITMLERLIQYMRSKPGVWFATHEKIARYALEHGGR
jgi:peptidoglycan/xylan/chitin deacetylase (PgdA/CDA1 family)